MRFYWAKISDLSTRILAALSLWWISRHLAEAVEQATPEMPPSVPEPTPWHEEVVATPLVERPRRPRQRRAPVLAEDAPLGPDGPVWEFRRDLLDRLEEYFYCFRVLRRHDLDSYDLFRRIGLGIPAHCFLNPENAENLEKLRQVERIGFGGILMPASKQPVDSAGHRVVAASFIYFRKLIRPPHVQLAIGDVYELTVIHDSRDQERLTSFNRCHVVMGRDGRCTLLKQELKQQKRFRPTRRNGVKGRAMTTTTTEWGYPNWLYDMIEDRKSRGETEWDPTPQDLASWLFGIALLTMDASRVRLVVRARSRSGLTAAFGVGDNRARYFFQDRDATALAKDGKRKRIFHAVIDHDRQVKNGVTRVRRHYRGIRHFLWNGYRVGIVLPSNKPLLECPIPAVDSSTVAASERDQYVGSDELGKRIDEHLVH